MNSSRRTSLNKKVLRSIVLFAVVLVIATGALVCVQYYYSQKQHYSEQAFDFARTAAKLIDGDRVLGYVETGEKDDYYYEILDFLNATQYETDLKYYYVFVPYEDDLVYVWDAINVQGACDLGHHEEYMSKESKAATFEVFRQNPPEKISIQKDKTYGHIASAYSPIFNSDGDPVAVVGVDLSIPGFRRTVAMYMLLVLAAIFTITLIALSFFYSSVGKNIINPISKLTRSTGEMVDNLESDKVIDIDIHTGDEIEDLAESIKKMDGDLRNYIAELSAVTAEKERIGTELNVAKRIQEAMLPNIFPPFPERKEFELYASMIPAKHVGGDFYDFFMVDDNHIALVMADVSGKGVPAALFMAISKVLLKTSVQAGRGPAETLERVNHQLLEGNDTGLFVTVWLAVIDITTGKGVAANAGHMHPALRRKNEEYELVMYKHSPAVATIEGVSFTEHDFELRPGDALFVYTDGVTEATNTEEELFGEDRMIEALNMNSDEGSARLLPAVKDAIDVFVGDAPQFDDITMLIFEYKGTE
ncbi:MAG: PP2C family protein-serine/threonine phosphatase [Mogibacterium sp.]|nr:PP2C family protein-serine/threonine phosphatase [Mogibacterium sp.]